MRKGEWARTAEGGVEVAGYALAEGEYFLSLVPKDPASARALPGNELVVSLSLALTAELSREGLARDLVRQVQEARKRAGFDVSDHIRLVLWLPGAELRRAVNEHQDMIASETLAAELLPAEGPWRTARRLPSPRARFSNCASRGGRGRNSAVGGACCAKLCVHDHH